MTRVVRRASQHSSREARDLIAAVLAADLAIPPTCLWLVSPWISDIELLDNSTGGFSQFFPTRTPRLSDVLAALCEAGALVVVATRQDTRSEAFLGVLENKVRERARPDRLRIVRDESDLLHTKALTSDSYALSGSMNFTVSGVDFNEEQLQLHVETDFVSEARLAAHARYGGLL